MDSDRWKRIERVYYSALEVKESRRSGFLNHTCGRDESLRREVESLLSADSDAADFLEVPALEIAAKDLARQSASGEQLFPHEVELAGRTVSHYRVLEKLGGGGMGVVFKAEDLKLGRLVALKFLPRELAQRPEAVAQLHREARAASALNHPHICIVHDIDEFERRPFIVMELLQGETLKQRIAEKPLRYEEIVKFGVQILDALEAAHANGIVHRDVKPANIFVTSRGDLKVLDFGLAKLSASHVGAALAGDVAETRAFVGTLPYMAPEQLQRQSADERTDIYAFGAVLFEMSSGRRAFPQRSTSQLVDCILNNPPSPPRILNATLPAELEEIILKCLAKDPADRFQSAKELAKLLQQLATADESNIRSTIGIAAVAIVMLAAGALAAVNLGWFARSIPTAITLSPMTHQITANHVQSVAVLPLENLSHDPDQEYFADGMTDALITDLAKIHALRVISRNSIMRYKSEHEPMPQIGRELNVDAVVEGTVVRSGDRVRITAQLIEASNDRHLWAESYERDGRDILTLQDEVAKAIADEVKITLTPQEKRRLASARPVNMEAHEAYLKGLYYLNKRNEKGFQGAIEYFNEAIQKDRNYALGECGLAQTYVLMGEYSLLPAREAFTKAREAAVKALQLDDTLAEAHNALAAVREDYDWDWSGAEREFRRAIELNPGYATAHQWYAELLSELGRHQEALAEIRQAQQLDPFSLIINAVSADALRTAGQNDLSIEQLRKTLQIDPNFAHAHFHLGLAYLRKGASAQAIAEFQRAVTLSPDVADYKGGLGYAYARAGKLSEARTMLDELKVRSKQRYVPWFYIAAVYAGLNEKSQAFACLEKAYEQREQGLAVINREPIFDPLRADPRYQDLLRRMNLPVASGTGNSHN